MIYAPVVCNGKTYSNACQANCDNCIVDFLMPPMPLPPLPVLKLACNGDFDCDVRAGFGCRKDLLCWNEMHCQTVCLNVNNLCVHDADCGAFAASQCVDGFCVHYQEDFTAPRPVY